jgi:hypothetical protein
MTTTPPKAETTQGMMRDLFAEKVIRKPASQNASAPRITTEDSAAASSLGADFEYEKAMRGGESRSRPSGKKSGGAGAVGRTESYRQAHNAGPAPAPQTGSDRKMQNYNSLPRLGVDAINLWFSNC